MQQMTRLVSLILYFKWSALNWKPRLEQTSYSNHKENQFKTIFCMK